MAELTGILIGIAIIFAVFSAFGPFWGFAWIIFGLVLGYLTRA